MPLQNRIGTVELVGRRRPRNHGVRIDGKLYIVPCGNLRKCSQSPSQTSDSAS